jgi:hypothetical protein
MATESHPISRYALCAEFGAGKCRMVFLFPVKEQLATPFPGAKCGKWFVQLEDGIFKLVEGEEEERLNAFELILNGLDKDICLKVNND